MSRKLAGMPLSLIVLVIWSASGRLDQNIPVIIGTAQIGVRFVFYGVVQIGKFQRIADE